MKFFYTLLLTFFIVAHTLYARTIKIASWNVENLFDMHYDGTEYEEYIPARHGWSEAMLRKKLRNTAQVICDLDADMIALQEIENDRILSRLQKFLKRVGCPYPYRAISGGLATVHVALLSRISLAKIRDIPVTRFGRQRHILEVILDTNRPLRLFINHWRSKRAPESQRILYAKALRKRLESLPPSTEYILLGDFNSDWEEFRIISPKHNDTGGKTGINHILVTTRNSQMIRYSDLIKSQGAFIHYNLWLDLPSAKRWSHNFFGKKEAIDSMLIPPSLADGKAWEYIRGSFDVYRPSYLFGAHGEIFRWRYRHAKHMGRGFSDHLPIYASFTLNSKKSSNSSKIAVKSKTDSKKIVDAQCTKKSIEELVHKRSLKMPFCIQNAVVVFKRGGNAVLQESVDSAAILVYGAADALREGRRYRIKVEGFKRYHGMPEITDLEPLEDLGKVSIERFIKDFRADMMKKPDFSYKIVRDIVGRYKNKHIFIKGGAWPIYFHNRRLKPRNGSLIRIKRAQIGYYNGNAELIIWDKKDFEILGR